MHWTGCVSNMACSPSEVLPPVHVPPAPACHQAVFVAASKVDLPGRKVTEADGRAWAVAHNVPYFEVSCPAPGTTGQQQSHAQCHDCFRQLSSCLSELPLGVMKPTMDGFHLAVRHHHGDGDSRSRAQVPPAKLQASTSDVQAAACSLAGGT